MARMYVVKREGSSNTHTHLGIVGTVEAESPQSALSKANDKFQCYVNQYLSVTARCSREDCQIAFEADLEHDAQADFWNQVDADAVEEMEAEGA